MSDTKDSKPREVMPRHRVLREVLRHYLEFRELVTSPEYDGHGGHRDTSGIIEHGYWATGDDGVRRKVHVTLSFWDLQDSLKELSPRKCEAVFYNVILDKKQKDVAEIMGITTVSVGQYVEQACLQIAETYFADDYVMEVKS